MRLVQQAIMDTKEEAKEKNQASRKVIINILSKWIRIKYQKKKKNDIKEDSFIIYDIPTMWVKNESVEIRPLKARHDVTKLELIVPFLSFWCIDIDLSIQPMSLTLYMTSVH